MKLTMKLAGVLPAILLLATSTGAQTFTVLKHFNPNINATGYNPQGTPVQGSDGTLYGVATAGGAGAAGVVFRIQTNGTDFTVIKSFDQVNTAAGTNADGSSPNGGLVLSGDTLYGTTLHGGGGGNGTVFSLETNGSNFAVLKSFPASDSPDYYTNGANPAGVIVSNGVLFGTTQIGGQDDSGIIFRLNTDGSGFTNIYTFTDNSDGATPSGRLLLAGDTLYGTAEYDGDNGGGTVFSVLTNGDNFMALHGFSGSGIDGADPVAGLVLSGGQLFGTTQYGDSGDGSNDGTVFRLDIDGNNFTNLYSFTDTDDGYGPMAELTLSGNTLYGTTRYDGFGGAPYGTVFKLNTDGSEFATVITFNDINGWGPDGGMVLSDGVLYGVTYSGGTYGIGYGAVYSVHTDGSDPVAIGVFNGPDGGRLPQTGLAWSGSKLIGTTTFGGTYDNGTLFEMSTNGSGFALIHDFSNVDSSGDNADGNEPRAVPVLSGGIFYGLTRYGGTNGQGTVFRFNADGTGFTNLYSFNDVHLDAPEAGLVVSGSTLYGATPQGGNGQGSVFKIGTDGGNFTNIYSFNGTDGSDPLAGLVQSGNTLYGTTYGGGTGYGNIFQVDTDGTHYTNIYSFSPTVYNGDLHTYTNTDGANPGSVLVLSNNVLYGTTFRGGVAGQGTVFRINTDRTGFAVLHQFAGTNSSGAIAGDLLLSGGTFYGTTAYDGGSNQGAIFQMDADGNNFTVLKNFTGSDGAFPNPTLVRVGNTLYGTTFNGGLSGNGTVFSLSLSSTVSPIPLSIHYIGNAVVLSWSDPMFALQSSTVVTGTYTNVPGATSPYTNALSPATQFFRLRAN